MKYLIFSDCHWSTYTSIVRGRGKKFSIRLEYLINSLNWLNKIAIEQHCDSMICAGDFMDKAQCTDEELTALRQIDWNSLNCYFVCGNHESSVSDLRFSSIKALESSNRFICEQVTLISDPKYNIILLPYVTDKERKPLTEYINKVALDKAKPIIIVSHNDIAGIQYGGFLSKSGFNIDEIQANCNLFLNGHLHNSEWVADKVLNVGSFSGHNFTNDSTKYKYGIWILDTDTSKIEFIENPYSLQFYKFDIASEADLKQIVNIKANSILSIKCIASLQQELNKILDSIKDKVLENRIILIQETSITADEKAVLPTLTSDYFGKFSAFCKQNIQADSATLEAELAEICK